MDELRLILTTFSVDDRKEFTRFIQRQKKKKDRKDLELFQLLLVANPLKTPDLLKKLYPDEPNPVAYYALRKRLMRHLTSYIQLKQFENDSSAAATVMGLLSMAGYLFGNGLEKQAWQNLQRAEKLALEHELFDLLNAVYNLQIEQAESEFAPGLDSLIEKRNYNKKCADQEERANIANSVIRRKMQIMQQQVRDLQFGDIIKETLESCGVTEAVSQRPSLLYKLMSIARSAVLVRKDFFYFEPYIIGKYEQMKQGRGFLPAHRYYQLGLLYMIAHVLYRNRKFGKSVQYLHQMEMLLRDASQGQQAQFYPRYVFLLSACHAFLNDLPKAIALLQNLLTNYQQLLSPRNLLTAHMQLSFYFFAKKDFAPAWQMLQSIDRSDAWCEKKMGRDWMLKKKTGEVIIQLELQNPDLAGNRLKTIERDFKDMLQGEAYPNERAFIKLLWQMIDQPDFITRPEFMEKVENSITFQPMEQEDLPNISFYAWLRSKMQRCDYFDLLREFAGMEVLDEV